VEVRTIEITPGNWPCDFLAAAVFEDDWSSLDRLESGWAEGLKALAGKRAYKGKAGEVLLLPLPGEPTLAMVGLGKKGTLGQETVRQAAGEAVRAAVRDRGARVLFFLPAPPGWALSKAAAEGAILAGYSFEKYRGRGEDEPPRFEVETLLLADGDEAGLQTGAILGEAQNYARDLANEPGNVITPESLAETARKIAEESGLECTVFDDEAIRQMGMEALWSVGKGSKNKPRLIHLAWKPGEAARERIALVGKGLTFDSGGLNIKPGDFMRTMKGDKSGACAVLAAMSAVSALGLPLEVHGLIGAAENMPGGDSYRPDDIVRAKNGKTIEIDNTDAEGRLTLADVLCYASDLEPAVLLDIATLTGSCHIALGDYTAGLFSPEEKLVESLMEASRISGERLWPFPMDDERLRKKLKSDVADLVNSGGRYGGAIFAAMFLQEFVKKGIPWAHIDMAGTDHSKEEYGYVPRGFTGFGTRTMLEFLLGRAGRTGA
jgi:leucyl aminopeptidase